MKAIVFAGGNQTRFGKTIDEQPKVLYPVNQVPLLLHTLTELDSQNLEEIIVRVWNKEVVKDYINSIKSDFVTSIFADERNIESAGEHIFESKGDLPSLFIFGDSYFPKGYLKSFISEVKERKDVDAVIAVTPYHVGDSNVVVKDGHVTGVLKQGDSPYFTCGLFAALNPKILDNLEKNEKVANLFSQMVEKGCRVGYVVLGKGVADLDTLEIALSLRP